MAGARGRTQHGLQWSVLATLFTGVSASDSSVAGLAAASSICFILLIGIIFYIALSFSWSDWYNNWMRGKGKVRMPKAYWKKKEEAKRRLLSASASHGTPSVVNGNLPAQSVDRAPDSSRASWVQGWSQRNTPYGNKAYEEKDMTIDMGEEQDDEFRIETVLTDNEVLDVGPFKSSHVGEKAIEGDIYPEPYIYTTVDSARTQEDNNGTTTTTVTQTVTTTRTEGSEMREVSGEASSSGEYRISSTEDMLVHL